MQGIVLDHVEPNLLVVVTFNMSAGCGIHSHSLHPITAALDQLLLLIVHCNQFVPRHLLVNTVDTWLIIA